MKTIAKIAIRTIGIIISSIICFQLIQALLIPWDGFQIQSKPIIGNATQYQPE